MKTTLLFASVLATLATAAPAASASDCSAVHIIVARASTEAQGEGIIGALATDVKKKVPGTTSEAVVYPAALAPYASSENKGVVAMKQQM
jgi:acetylxylan esterase